MIVFWKYHLEYHNTGRKNTKRVRWEILIDIYVFFFVGGCGVERVGMVVVLGGGDCWSWSSSAWQPSVWNAVDEAIATVRRT